MTERAPQLPATRGLLNQALSVKDKVDAVIARLEGEPEALVEQLGQADGLAQFVKRWQAAAEEKRQAANAITIARLKLIAAIVRAIPKTKGRGNKNLLVHRRFLNPNTLTTYRKVEANTAKFDAYEQLLEESEADASISHFISWAHVKPHKQLGRKHSSSGATASYEWSFAVADCRELPLENDSVDLVFCSPPYEGQRAYDDVAFDLCGDEWVQWAVECFEECLRVCKGLVAWVVEGSTDEYRYSCTPFLLMCELHRRGYTVRKPCVYHRLGIPGTGGPEWLRNDWEPIICATRKGKMPWCDNTAMGGTPVVKGNRVATNRKKDGSRKSCTYKDPEKTNPGNIIHGKVGAGQLGWKDAHLNEAPFPQWLANFFVRSFCPVGGTVLDPFSGSGTTVAAAVAAGRNGIGFDIREDQVWLGETRLQGLTVAQRKGGQKVLL